MLFATVPEDPSRFIPLSIVLLLAFFVPILLSRFRGLPVVVGEIIAGVLVGPSLLGWVSEGPILTFMSDIGLAFLMFLAGLEIDFDAIFPKKLRRGNGMQVVPLAFWIYLGTLALALPGAWLVKRGGLSGDFWMMIFVLSATSLGVLLPVLKEREVIRNPFGRLVFITAMLADFITVLGLTFYLITLDKGLSLEVFSVGLLFVAFVVIYRVGPGFVQMPSVKGFFEELSRATVQIKVRGAIAILMLFVVMAEFVGAELILGAFLGGMIISLLKGPEDEGLVHKLEAFGFGFFIPVFFILVGVELDVRALMDAPESLLFLPLLLLVSLVVKILPMFLAKKYFSWREVLGGGVLLNTHLSLEVAVAVIGARLGLFDAATSTTVILFAVISVILMPLLFGAILPHIPQQISRFTLIVEANELGIQVAEQLRAHGDHVKFIDDDPTRLKKVQEKGFTGFANEALLNGSPPLDPSHIFSALVLSEDDTKNLEISTKVQALGVANIIALVKTPEMLREFQRLGIKPFSPAIQRATMLSMMARNADVLSILTSTQDERDSWEVVLANPTLVGTQLRELQLPGDLLVLAIHRNGEFLIPRGNTRLEMHDRLSLVGNLEDLKDIRSWLEN
ncbi:MAG: cation:proton antiporter [Anaerolineales bacterium]|nr:cation:proton antiporter [Anaerolineales bacterium]